MARIRTIKPEIWASEILGRMTPLARLTYIGLISLADDDGRGRADIRLLRSHLHPYGSPNVLRSVPAALSQLAQEDADGIPMAVFYSHGSCSYYWLPTFNAHQRIDKPRPSKIPPAPNSEKILGILQDRSLQYQGSRKGSRKGREGDRNPPESATPGDDSGGPSAPKGKPDPAIEELLEVYEFCKTPGDAAKRRAFEDLARQGVSVERIKIYPTRVNVKGRDFFEIIRTLTPSNKPGLVPGKTKKATCAHKDTKVVSTKGDDELLECVSPSCDYPAPPWRVWRSDLKEQVKK